MKKLLLMIQLLSVIGLMSGCGGKDVIKQEIVYEKITGVIPSESIYEGNYTTGTEIEFNPYMIYKTYLDLLPSYIRNSYVVTPNAGGTDLNLAIVKVDDPNFVTITYTFWLVEGPGTLSDGNYGIITPQWDATESPNAEGKVIISYKFKVKSQS